MPRKPTIMSRHQLRKLERNLRGFERYGQLWQSFCDMEHHSREPSFMPRWMQGDVAERYDVPTEFDRREVYHRLMMFIALATTAIGPTIEPLTASDVQRLSRRIDTVLDRYQYKMRVIHRKIVSPPRGRHIVTSNDTLIGSATVKKLQRIMPRKRCVFHGPYNDYYGWTGFQVFGLIRPFRYFGWRVTCWAHVIERAYGNPRRARFFDRLDDAAEELHRLMDVARDMGALSRRPTKQATIVRPLWSHGMFLWLRPDINKQFETFNPDLVGYQQNLQLTMSRSPSSPAFWRRMLELDQKKFAGDRPINEVAEYLADELERR